MVDRIQLERSWKEMLEEEFDKDYFQRLTTFLKLEKAQGKRIYPPGPKIFASLDTVPFEDVNVVILGQDPYHGPNQANGLCFSVNQGVEHPPSLVNIFKELGTDQGMDYPQSGDLIPWARQGVLLLNAILTVEAHQAGSHQNKGWELFTDSIIQKLSDTRSGLVFMLWGGYAKRKGSRINRSRHCVLESGHPSPLSANRGYWFGNKHFSRANAYLTSVGKDVIDWTIV